MKVHAPPNLDLPPLKIDRRAEREMIEESPEVQALIGTKLLLDPIFNELLMAMLNKTKDLLKLVELASKAKSDPVSKLEIAPSQKPSLYDFLPPPTVTGPSYFVKEFPVSVFLSHWQEHLEKQAVEARLEVRKQIIAMSNQMQNVLSKFEIDRRLEIPVLSSTALYVCPKCNRVVSVGWFRPVACQCGTVISTVSDVLQIPIKHFSESLVKFLEANYWLEHGIAHLLRQKNLSVEVGMDVLGHSGVWHEIDVIGESRQQNYRIFCECKNSELKASHVFVFFGKMTDVGCTRGYMFTTRKQESLQIFRLARSKNICIVEDVLRRPNSDLLDELKDV
jgi:hypothetical protein